jgi:hypothetical protein
MLLPIPNDSARKMSLTHHMALAVCRDEGGGNSHQFNELLRVIYVTHHLQEAGFGTIPEELYGIAEAGMNAALARVKPEKVWRVDEKTALILEQIVGLHDEQLRSVTLRDLTAATERLERFIHSDRLSPLPESVRRAAQESQSSESTDEPGDAPAA